jgi:hypothetical protein
MSRVFVRGLDPRLKDEGPVTPFEFFVFVDRFFLSRILILLSLTLIRQFAFGIIGAFIMGFMNEVIVNGRRTVQKTMIAYKELQASSQQSQKPKVHPSNQQQQQRKDDLTTTVALKLFMTFLYTLQVLQFFVSYWSLFFSFFFGPVDPFLMLGLSSLFCWSCTSHV